jgi:beta-barrel assembly-enhancing protease
MLNTHPMITRCASIIVILLWFTLPALAQTTIQFQKPIHLISNDKYNKIIKVGEEVSVSRLGVSKVNGFTDLGYFGTTSTGKSIFISRGYIKSYEIKKGTDVIDSWQGLLVESGVLVELIERGYQYGLRNDMHNDAIDFVNTLQQNDRFFNDDYLEDYLYTLINTIHSGLSNYGKPGNLSVKILKDIEPNAYILSNGIMIVSTGLLSAIQSEDELVGVLSHEIAHYVLDHHVTNYNKALDRQKRAEFWAAFATVIAASADVYLTTKSDNHIPGLLTASTFLAATILTEAISTQLGIKYSQTQELQADAAAEKILSTLSFDKRGLALALSRMKTYFVHTGNYMALSGGGTHPTLEARLSNFDLQINMDSFAQPKYLKRVSLVNTHNAWIELWMHNHALAALELVERNISNGIATERDYIIAAVVKRRQTNSVEDLKEVLKLLATAKALDVERFILISKEEGITYLRLNNKIEAKKAFELYHSQLLDFKSRNGLNETQNRMPKLEEELDWAQKMVYKADRL